MSHLPYNLPELPEDVYRVPEPRMEELQATVDKFGRRAAKLGLAPITIEVVGEDVVPLLSDDDGEPTGRFRVFNLVKVNGEAPVVAGHTFIARVEHTEAGNIISKAPGCEDVIVPAHIRDGKPTCDHCKTRRARKDTFVLKDENGILIRVGRNCLADYLRSKDAAAAIKIWNLLSQIRQAACCEDPDACFGFGGTWNYDATVVFVACVIRSIALYGWTSRKDAYQDESKTSTATDASFACSPCPNDSRAAEDWRKAQPTDVDHEEAGKAVEWAKTLEGVSDYESNLKVACTLEYVKPKNHGLVASVVVAYRRFVERELAKARKTEKGESAHFGKIGSRYVRKLTMTRRSSWSKSYNGAVSVTVLYVMEDEDGNVFKWFSSGGCWLSSEVAGTRRELRIGDEFYFTFAVKDHGEFNGQDETTILRAVASVDKPTHKWMSEETGEVFKTRKAMKVATEAV